MAIFRRSVRFCALPGALLLLGSASVGCSSKQPSQSHLSVASRDPHLTAEQQWLRDLQMVTVLDSDSKPTQVGADVVDTAIGRSCFGDASLAIYAAKDVSENLPSTADCIGYLTNVRAETCTAQTLLAAATLQAEPLNIPLLGVIPQQTEETDEALAEMAIGHALSAFDNASNTLAGNPECFNLVQGTTIEGNPATDADGNPIMVRQSVTTGTDFTTAYAEAYNTAKDAYERAVEATLNASDRMRSRSVSPNDGAAKAISGAKLSRAAAAHLLVGGAPGLAGKTANPLCVDSQLSPQAKTALQIFRNAAPAPTDILDDSLPLNTLLNGSNPWDATTGRAGPHDGSIRERLFQFYSYSRLAPGGKTVEQFFGLNTADFAAARAFLKQEISAFSRASAAQLEIPTTGRVAYRFYRYSGTAKEPTELPPVAWTARARYATNMSTTLSSLDQLLNNGYVRSANFMQAGAVDIDPSTQSEALAPFSMILSGRENLGQWTFTNGYSYASGFNRDDRLRVVVGETGLRCAVQGDVEGASCADPATPPAYPCDPKAQPTLSCLTLAKLDSGPDTLAVSNDSLDGALPDTRLYLVRPRTPSSPELPGYFEALTGTTVTDGVLNDTLITPSLDRRVAEVLAPSKKYCSVPQVSCAGVTMDARLPLEDELTNDNDGVESSWKHYLALAKEAAQEADNLGQDYINSGLTVGANAAQDEIRQEEQLQRANDALQEVQSTCGTAVDSHTLLNLLVSTGPDKKIVASTNACSASTDCNQGYDCRSGSCVPNLGALAALHSDEDPDLRRLAACLDDSQADSTVNSNVGTYPFVTLGDHPLCVTVVKTDHSRVCPTGSGICPSPAGSNGTCAPPTDSNLETLPAKALSYYSSNGTDAPANACDILRIARANPREGDGLVGPSTAVIDKLKATGLLQPARAQASIKKIFYQPKYGGYIDMGFDGVAAHTDGSFTTGPDQSGWPCASPTSPDTCTIDGKDATGLFCHHINCLSLEERDAFHTRVRNASVAAAILLASANTDSWDDVKSKTLDWAQIYFASTRYLDNLNPSYIHPPPSVDSGNPGASQIQYFHGTGSPVLRNNFGYFVDYAPRNDGSDSWDGHAQLGLKQFAFFDWPIYSWFNLDPGANVSPRDFFWAQLSDFRSNKWAGAAWLAHILKGEIKPDQPLDGVITPKFSTETTSPQVLDANVFLDGLELICEGVSVKSNGPASGAPPSISTFEDVGRASDYLTGIADGITKRASRMVFSDIPAIALDAGRETSSFGAFPQLGGKMGEAVVSLRIALLQVRTALPAITGELNQFGAELKSLQAQLQKNEVLKEIRNKQLESTVLNQLADCAVAVAQNGSLNILNTSATAMTAIIRCVNAAAQIGLATQINDLENEAGMLDSSIAQDNFAGNAAQHARALQLAALSLQEAAEQIDAATASIDSLKKAAKVSVSKAVYLASWQSQQQLQYTTALGTLKTEKQNRYAVALNNAKRLSFFAKRAIEQRLGVQLSEMHDELPLVAAPATWEGKLCDMTGVNFDALQNSKDTSYSEGFIGDYVTKLGNLVESYRIQNNFRQGSDVAVISLRDDVLNVRSDCDVPSNNLLFQSATLDSRDRWQAQGCTPISVEDIAQSSQNCVAAVPSGETPFLTGNQQLSGASGYQLQFGDGQGCTADTCGWQAGAGLFQAIHLEPGLYRLSWYTPYTVGAGGVISADGARIGRVLDSTGTDLALDFTGSPLLGQAGEWARAFATFTLEASGDYQVGFGTAPSVTAVPAAIGLAAPMLELLPLNGTDMDLRSFERTSTTRNVKLALCEDTDGAIFRATQWKRDCIHLCDSGFSNNCANGPVACYREATFGISQSAIQNGKVFNFSGFAKGNFNYRIDQLALNFVGTGIRDCADSLLPTTCSGAGFVTYSFDHTGPFFVRNFDGNDFRAFLFDGHIEQARGLASERYITNPLGSSDRGLLADYERAELQGRPLDGNFAIRVWEDPSINFEHIQDVQLVLNYSYWTRFK